MPRLRSRSLSRSRSPRSRSRSRSSFDDSFSDHNNNRGSCKRARWDSSPLSDADSLDRYIRRQGTTRRSLSPVRRPDDPSNPFRDVKLNEDANEDLMRLRKRALALGKFRVLTKDGKELEETQEFRFAVRKANERPIRYTKVPRGFDESNYPKTRYSIFRAQYPGVGERYVIVWTTLEGDIKVDRMVKLYDIESIQSHEIDCGCLGPKSPWFGLVDPRIMQTPDDSVNFDANMFWSVGLLFKHFRTCGVEVWDKELAELCRTYAWTQATKVPIGHGTFVDVSQPPPPVVQPPPPPQLSTSSTLSAPSIQPAPPPSFHPPEVPEVPPPTLAEVSTPSEPVPDMGARYTGCVVDWRTSYGFLQCNFIPCRIFLHLSNIVGQKLSELPVGASVNFRLSYDEKKGYQAEDARLFL